MVPFDVESTGIDPETDRIVSISLGGVQRIIRPMDWTIPDDAAKIHGITQERALAEGESRREVLEWAYSRMIEADLAGIPLVGFNLSYDLTMIDREFRRAQEIDGLGIGQVPASLMSIDAYVLDKQADKYRKGSRKLINVAKHYGIALSEDDAHDASFDADASEKIARAIGQRYGEQMPTRIEDLNVAQVWWRFTQQTSLEEYLQRSDSSVRVNKVYGVQPHVGVRE